MSDIMWWGYLHENGTPQLKRWFGDHKDYKDDCYDNPFVEEVVPPFAADSREDAVAILYSRLGLSNPDNNDDIVSGYCRNSTVMTI